MKRALISLPALLWAAASLSAQQPGWTIVGFRITAQTGSFSGSFSDSVDRISGAGIKSVEGNASQVAQAGADAVRQKLRAAGVAMPVYYVSTFPGDESGMRELFSLAKSLAVETIVGNPAAAQLESADKLANESGVNLALPEGQVQALKDRSRRIGIYAETPQGAAAAGDRLLVLRVRPDGRAAMEPVLWQIYRAKIKPTALVIAGSDSLPAIKQTAEFLEKITLAVLADFIDTTSRTTQPRFNVTAEERQKIEAAAPTKLLAQPRKQRKLLVVDMQAAYGGHHSLPFANIAIQTMAKTGAFEPVFNDDFANLRWDKLRQYDALYLNNTVGPIFNSQDVRDSLLRFVREGGGLGGHHGTGRASLDWPEFAEMLGAYSGPHTVSNESVTLKVEDPKSPLNAGFENATFPWIGEFFRYPSPPYSREKLHVLLTIDTSKTDMSRYTCAGCTREDGDYAVSWIRTYGKGRVFYTDLGHNATDFMSAMMLKHFFAGIQYILGDLDADSTPSAKLAGGKE
jgi:type 1 glutamine amidotransferase